MTELELLKEINTNLEALKALISTGLICILGAMAIQYFISTNETHPLSLLTQLN